ncbi:MAU2 chromatid cohesion factor homolog [Panonychus citri]|uniref:MAU2 chromatid cohesion factor homolog n=1 Tax=Panonychus citri TaxID=50023 RepID=UPI002307A912|nr:MAU2 chromatid cohesion factor homolog [Panonychus citri]
MAAPITLDNCYVSLLSMAEGFKASNPPDVKRSVQCLQAILNLPVDHYTMAKTHLQIGSLISKHTTNIDIACKHFEDAWRLSHSIPGAEDIMLESIAMLVNVYERQNEYRTAKDILSKGLEGSSNHVWWHCKFLFQLAQIHAKEHDYMSSANILSAGADYAQMSGASYTRILFLLSKGMMLLIGRSYVDAHTAISLAQQLLESWQGNNQQKESLTVFFLILQVCHHLNAGKAKSAKSPLKILQHSIQNLSTFDSKSLTFSMTDESGFHWMPKEYMCVLVYLVTVLHSMQAGYMDRVQKYTEKALMQIEKLKMIDNHPLLHTFQLILLEHISMCRLVMGNRTIAIKETVQAIHICNRDHRLKVRHQPVIHSLLGLYSMSMNVGNTAEFHLRAVLASPGATAELKVLASLNLSIVYLRMARHSELNELLVKLNPDTLQSASQSVKAACLYVLGLNAFFQNRFNDAKRFLRDTLQMANCEELNRLTSCSLVLLGHIFFALGNCKESMNMVTPAMELASKIPDIHVQLWATSLLNHLYGFFGNSLQAQKADQTHNTFSQHYMNDYYQASQTPEHSYINWTGD